MSSVQRSLSTWSWMAKKEAWVPVGSLYLPPAFKWIRLIKVIPVLCCLYQKKQQTLPPWVVFLIVNFEIWKYTLIFPCTLRRTKTRGFQCHHFPAGSISSHFSLTEPGQMCSCMGQRKRVFQCNFPPHFHGLKCPVVSAHQWVTSSWETMKRPDFFTRRNEAILLSLLAHCLK